MHAAAPASMPSSFWNANAAVEALRRVYVDAGRLIDSVEREQELVAAEQHASVGDAVLSNEIPAAAAAAAGARATPHRGRPASAAGSGAAAAAAAAAASPATAPSTAAIERVATVQFFAIRDLESSTNLLLQRLNTAKEEYVRRFAERSSLLNQTLGHVSKTHPREANRLSRLAKSVQQARAVVPWMTGFVEHFDVGGGAPGSGGLFSSPSSHGGGGMALPVAPQSPPIVFRAADIIMGKVHPALSHG